MQFHVRDLGGTSIDYHINEDGIAWERRGPWTLWRTVRTSVPWDDIITAGWGWGIPHLIASAANLHALIIYYTDRASRPRMRWAPVPQDPETSSLLEKRMKQALGSRWEPVFNPTIILQSAQTDSSFTTNVKHLVLGLALAAVTLAVLYGLLIVFALLAFPFYMGIGPVLLALGLKDIHTWFTIQHLPTAKAGAAAIGLVECQGQAVIDTPTIAPISRTPCQYWKVVVEERVSADEDSWTCRHQQEEGELSNIRLTDVSGYLTVWTRGAELSLKQEQWQSNRQHSLLPSMARFYLQNHQISWPPEKRGAPLRITESRLETNANLYVLGTLTEWRDAARWLQEQDRPWTAITFFKDVIGWVYGWNKGDKRLAESALPTLAPHDTLLWKGTRHAPFIISCGEEHDLLLAVRKRAAWRFVLAAVIIWWQFFGEGLNQ